MKKLPLLMSVLLGLSSSAFADWTLLNDESSLHYVSIKSTNIAEMNRFKTLTGSVSEQGAVELKVDLSSVDTGVDIRDERMQTMLFDVAQFAQATVTGKVDLERVTKLEVGETYTDSITLNLALHGLSKEVSSHVQVTRLADDKVLITTLEPVVLNAADYKLAEGLEALRVIAKLPAISPVVPVTYSLVFQQ
ncbi:MAG: YceI family protein [Gammaproteobacteria bacterium]|nr:YceI family protein [Gammaproteobacteria bacterium]